MNLSDIFYIEETIAEPNSKFDRIRYNLNYKFLTCSADIFKIKLSNGCSYSCVLQFF